MPTVLFVLRRMHARVVGDHHNQPRVDAGIRHGEERIGGDVETDMLLTAKRSASRQRRSECGFHCRFFIGRPLAINFVELRRFLCYFGRRRARITRYKSRSRFVESARYRLVA